MWVRESGCRGEGIGCGILDYAISLKLLRRGKGREIKNSIPVHARIKSISGCVWMAWGRKEARP